MGRLGPLKAPELTTRVPQPSTMERLVTLAAEGFKYGPIYTCAVLLPTRYGRI